VATERRRSTVGVGDVAVRGEEGEKRLSPNYSWSRVIAGAPHTWFAGDKYTPGELISLVRRQ
jgi:hypothetical protein